MIAPFSTDIKYEYMEKIKKNMTKRVNLILKFTSYAFEVHKMREKE